MGGAEDLEQLSASESSDSSEDSDADQEIHFPKLAGFENQRLSCHLNSTLIVLFSSRFVSAFLEGNAFRSGSLLHELSRLRVAQCDEQHPQSTVALQEILSEHATFQNYFGDVQDARETYLYLGQLIKAEGVIGEQFIELITIPVTQRIIYKCQHEQTIPTTQYVIDLHEDYLRNLSVPLGTHILHGCHQQEDLVDHQCERCSTWGCRISYHVQSLPKVLVLGVVREMAAVPQNVSLPLTFMWSEREDARKYMLVGCVCYAYPEYHFYAIVCEDSGAWIMYSDTVKERWPLTAADCIICKRVRYAVYEIAEVERDADQ
jgi:hypothetical protein